jgi:hypothetical protein
MKIKTTQPVAIAALCLVLVLSAVYIFFMRSEDVREDIKAAPKAVQPEKAVAKLEIKADKKQLIVNPDALKGVRLSQGQINIPGTAPVAEPEPLDIWEEEETPEAKPLQDYNYISVSIANTSGEPVISSSIPDDKKEIEQYKMVSVENMGQPRGVSFRPQPVKAMAQKDLESEELKQLKEIQLKRKSNFAKELEERRARKGLYER